MRLFATYLALLALPAAANASELIPFTLPWNDAAPGVTDLSSYNHAPAGKYGYITVDEDAHFSVNGQRVRFWGVNITSESCFPTHSEAEQISARLAKFGFNIVRFHHMDNNWADSALIDYDQGNSRSLDAANLERLDYFIAQLKQHGIYSNINLVNSREFLPADGLDPSITTLSWKQRHVLGFVDQAVRDLEKEFASELLSHLNPYTGLSYAEDPAIAVVEVNNENGIFQQYFEGSIDAWPDLYKEKLQTGWNDWLQNRYGSTEALLAAWSGESVPLGEQHQGAAVAASTGTFAERHGVRINVTTAGGDGWHVQLNQRNLTFEAEQLYTISFWVRADEPRSFSTVIQQAYDPWGPIKGYDGMSATTEWTQHEILFHSPVSDTDLRLNFSGLGKQTGSIYFADVTIQEGGSLEAELPPGESLEAGTISNNLSSQSYLINRATDWTRYLTSVALDYWTDMRDFLEQTLGYDGLVTGSTIMNSPPNIQSVFEFVDTHAYWQHPVFPGADWDSTNWYVNPVSMVNTLQTTIGNLARQRLEGYPHTVSEYRHAYPNPFASEGPLLIAAYAALQDWDGIYFFDYSKGTSWDQGFFDGYFNMNAHPSAMANALVGANIFHCGDVAAAKGQLLMNFHPDREIEAITTQGRAWNVGDGRQLDIPVEHFSIQRIALSVGESATGLAEPPAAPSGPVYASDTGELVWDHQVSGKGVVTIDSHRSKGIVGFIDGRDFTLGEVRIEIGDTIEDWATLTLTMQEGAFDTPLKASRMLIVATGLTENTGMVWTDETKSSVGRNWGEAPSLVEAIPATIHLPFVHSRLQAWTLDETGQRAEPLAPIATESGSSLQIGGASKSLWYEVEIAADPEADHYGTWKKSQFDEAQQTDGSISGPTADADSDGIPNLMEFLLGLDPQSPDTRNPIQQGVEWRDRKPVFTYTFKINRAYPSESLSLDSTQDLAAWTTIASESSELDITINPLDASHEQIRIEYAPDSYPAFSRLKVQ